ncbi:GGDEF domain-containing protein [Eggerthella sp. NSJ-70]|uniref:GGDEF domain-containing protein n=1 Tax=Eggerthella hominis TaxID=2763043 RepID=A0ABR7BT93_9ACTN|nr:diguanylate cyclase [Eggerthella hominis]MBC5584590.1 GGDEF domain-containing protein [Eggerthella hominis]
MGGAHNQGHAKDTRGARTSVSLRPALAVIVSLTVVVLVVYAIFHAYSNALSDEFYDLASDSMNDYTVAQKVEVESFISEVSSTISTMRVLAESPDVDLTGSTFTSYLEKWNEQGSFQISYAPIEQLEEGVEGDPNERDADTLRRLKAGETVVSDVRKSSRLDGYYFSIAEPVDRDGRVVGVLRSIVKAEKLLETSQLSSQVMLLGTLLIKEDGTIVSVSSRYEEDEGRSLYDLLESRSIDPDQIADIRSTIENDRDVSTVAMGKRDGLMTFLTSIRLDVNDWTIVNFTQESALAERSESILRSTVYTAALLIAISAAACLVVALVVSRARRRARRSAERYAVLAEFSDTVLFEYSYPRDTLELTPNARGMFSLGSLCAEGYLGKGIPLIDFLEGDYQRVHLMFEKPAPPNELRTTTCRARVLSGEYRWFSFTCRYLYEGAQPYMAVGKIVDITKQRETEELLTRKSQIDGLTKTLNKVTFQEKMAALLPVTDKGLLFVIDMDRFKQINDEHGHSMGDRVLEGVAQSLLDVFRHRDPVGRIGGDEFVAFLAGADDAAVIQAKREALESLIAEASRSLGVPIAMSIGVARYPQDGATYQELFDAADQAMYDEKNEGRD